MRRLRTILDIGLPVLGIVLILGSILVLPNIYNRLAVVLVGIICIQIGMWQLAHRFLPSERRFHALRRELDAFVECCHQLNQAALAIKMDETSEQQAAFNDIHRALHESVELIAEVAGKTEEELAHEPRKVITLR